MIVDSYSGFSTGYSTDHRAVEGGAMTSPSVLILGVMDSWSQVSSPPYHDVELRKQLESRNKGGEEREFKRVRQTRWDGADWNRNRLFFFACFLDQSMQKRPTDWNGARPKRG